MRLGQDDAAYVIVEAREKPLKGGWMRDADHFDARFARGRFGGGDETMKPPSDSYCPSAYMPRWTQGKKEEDGRPSPIRTTSVPVSRAESLLRRLWLRP